MLGMIKTGVQMDKFWNINIILVINKKQQAKQAAT
jgi:hypothetical protein